MPRLANFDNLGDKLAGLCLRATGNLDDKVFQKLPNATLRQRIADKMREAILTGNLPEG